MIRTYQKTNRSRMFDMTGQCKKTDHYPLAYDTHFTLFGIPIVKHNSSGSLGHEFISVIEDLEDDYEKLEATDFGVDIEFTIQKKQAIEEHWVK